MATLPKKTKKSYAEVAAAINKMHGERTIMVLSEDPPDDLDRISTGVLALDEILGGGLAVGKMVELFGPHGSGKTSIAMSTIAEVQKLGKKGVLIDLENAFDITMAEKSGINVDELIVSQPSTAEDVLQIIEMLLDVEDLGVIVVDSVAGMSPRAEIAGDYGDSHVGLVARLLSQGMRKLSEKLRTEKPEVLVIWINQIREKIGVMGYGPKTDTPGGRALKFWCDIRIEVSRTEQIKLSATDVNPIGHKVKIKTQKNRSAAPFQTSYFDILYETGISNESTLLDLAITSGHVKQSGAWFTFVPTGEKVQGRQAALAVMRSDNELYNLIKEAVKP
jgi:recombination protein RecA